MSKKTTNILALGLLSIMFCLAFLSSQGDSITMDELSHIPAGYSYLSQRDFRINPEHPPLIKDLAAFPLLFLDVTFPETSEAWTEPVNGQWWYGWELLFNSGNNPDQMVSWARFPMLLMLVFLGGFLFWWTKKEFGNNVALFVLALFAFSPNLLAHGRLVTTDIAAALGFVLSAYFWIKFLKDPSKKNVIITGLIFGICMLFKYSSALLIPFLGIITIVYALLKKESLLKYLSLAVLIGIIGVVFVIMPVYQFHISNYPVERQLSDTVTILESSPMGPLKDLCIWMADKPITRGLGHYFLGLLMATQRTACGNTVYFLNKVSGTSWWYYFPVVYVLKTPLAFSILTIMSLSLSIFFTKKDFCTDIINKTKNCILTHFTEFSMFVALFIYWGTSIMGNLNIGVRHVLPVLPFTYVLVSLGLERGLQKIKKPDTKKILVSLIGILLFWYAGSSLLSFPHYISYFNELAGGTDNGYKYVVDSNYDWGQDLRRLSVWVEEHDVQKIKVDFFGGGDPRYYLGDKYESLVCAEGPKKGWLAISATFLQSGRGEPINNFEDSRTNCYKWLDNYTPVDRAGKSIFIYYID